MDFRFRASLHHLLPKLWPLRAQIPIAIAGRFPFALDNERRLSRKLFEGLIVAHSGGFRGAAVTQPE